MRPRVSSWLTTLLILFAPVASASAANRPAPTGEGPPPATGLVPNAILGETAPGRSSLRARPPSRAAAAGETLYIFDADLEALSSPGNEGGWTHKDLSAKPTAWHRDSFLGCQDSAWWCGFVDSTWIFDSNRAGYDNDWIQYLENQVDLSGIPIGQPVTIGFKHRLDAEPDYDFGFVEVFDLDDNWIPVATFTGKIPNGQGCDSFTVALPDSIREKYNPVSFRFAFTSDVGYSSADGLYDGDGWTIDNITIKSGADVRFFDDGTGGTSPWSISTFPGVGDFYSIRSGVPTEDVCTQNSSKVWGAHDPVVLTLVPRLNNAVISPPIFTDKASTVLIEFDVYRNLPLNGCYFYEAEYRTRNTGDPEWSLWTNPTNFVYYGGSKDWARQRLPLPAAGNKDSVQFRLRLEDLSQVFCDGVSAYGNTYGLFDNLSLGVIGTAPPSFVKRDIDLFNDTFQTTPFFQDDNFNSPLGDSAVVQVNASRGYKAGSMHYRFNGGSFASTPLGSSTPALPTFRYADVPAGSYPADTRLEYYFAVTDSLDQTAYLPADAPSAQEYFSASVLPLKTATNPSLGCFDSLSTILFVNHFAGREPTPYLADAMRSWGYKFDTWNVNGPSSGIGNSLGGSSPTDLQYHWPVTSVNDLIQYSTIIWHAGDLQSFTITPEDQQVIQSWIQQSGKDRNFWIAGDNVGYELETFPDRQFNGFLSFTCGVQYLRDIWENVPQDSLHPLVQGVLGGPTAGRQLHLNGGCPLLSNFDLIKTHPSAATSGKTGLLFLYPNNQPAATRFALKYGGGPDSARAVFMGFSFNAIEEGGERLLTAVNILNGYFGEPACYAATAVEETPASEAPRLRTQLFQNAPNPFNPETVIRYSVAATGPVRIDIFAVSGARVRTLVDRVHDAGDHTARWNGTDDAGRPVGSGAYFYRLRAPGFSAARKLILLK